MWYTKITPKGPRQRSKKKQIFQKSNGQREKEETKEEEKVGINKEGKLRDSVHYYRPPKKFKYFYLPHLKE